LFTEVGAAEKALGKNYSIDLMLDQYLSAFKRTPQEQQLVNAPADPNMCTGRERRIFDDRPHRSASIALDRLAIPPNSKSIYFFTKRGGLAAHLGNVG
jgi:hypothetical protein